MANSITSPGGEGGGGAGEKPDAIYKTDGRTEGTALLLGGRRGGGVGRRNEQQQQKQKGFDVADAFDGGTVPGGNGTSKKGTPELMTTPYSSDGLDRSKCGR
ncbi:hypothetical protein niasHT_004197 [Heterodera trifolii]|uniref:Uncharacterized protein n=1 Tax=Heterodera trifolii TaxID=157864 RepID=A0ABD2MDY9_9BILA